jgi:hypothetical protein
MSNTIKKKLKNSSLEKLSPLQRRVVITLQRVNSGMGAKISVVAFFANSSRVVVGTAIRRINGKSEKYNLPFYIEGEGIGRNGMIVRLVLRSSHGNKETRRSRRS